MGERSWGERQLPAGRAGSCWGQAGCQGGGCRGHAGRGEISVQGVGVAVGGSPAPGACGTPPRDDGKCLGALGSGWTASGSFISHVQLIPLVLGCWKPAMGQDGFPCSHFLAGFTWGTGSSRKTLKPTFPSGSHLCFLVLGASGPSVEDSHRCGGERAVPRCLWDPRFWGWGGLGSDVQVGRGLNSTRGPAEVWA